MLQDLSTQGNVLMKFFNVRGRDACEISDRNSRLATRQVSLKPGYFSKQLSVPEGIGIVAAEFKGKK